MKFVDDDDDDDDVQYRARGIPVHPAGKTDCIVCNYVGGRPIPPPPHKRAKDKRIDGRIIRSVTAACRLTDDNVIDTARLLRAYCMQGSQ